MKNMTWQTSRNVFLIWQYLSGNAPWVHCLEVFTLTWPLTAKSQYFYINCSRVGLLRAKTKGHLRTQVWLLGSFPESKQVDGQVSEWYWPCPWWFSLSAFFPYTGLLPRGGREDWGWGRKMPDTALAGTLQTLGDTATLCPETVSL